MPFLMYAVVLLVVAASALFGLDLLTSPLPPQKPAAHIVRNVDAPANKLAQRAADQRDEAKEGNANSPLTPLYPTNPAANKDVRMVYSPTNETTGSAVNTVKSETTGAASAESSGPPAQAPAAAPAPAPVQTAATPPLQPAVQKTAGHCDVQACSSAYKSFRASDCTYQPFEGARRVCEPAAAQRTRMIEPQRVRVLTQRDEDEDVDADDDGAPTQRVIVIQRSPGGWR